MPYRHGYRAVLLLLPLILLAFWPGYFGALRAAPLALHAHGLSATAWLVLLAVQLWSIHDRRVALHRTAGLALFAIVPLFAGASLAAVQGGIALFVARSDPFHTSFGARLALVDLLALVTFVALVRQALLARRQVRAHAAAMLATALLVLPPIIGRLFPAVPGFFDWEVARHSGFALSFQLAMLVSIGGALAMWRGRRDGGAFLVVAASLVLQAVAFDTVAASMAWESAAKALLTVTPALLFALGALAAAGALTEGWLRVPPRPRPRLGLA
ncbi:hypothetical protein K7957_09855 [Sphingomonas yunnanensis]|uniref:hypothetical protein n=1 Tax=Sphingomonas yunnanensis TaxID=310400 RepID=UPI001CA6EFF6|nr:hypothetical protein [Sphingomonas yunnanensis]MBY9063235.1 hypothetical protein [Sphingomonas yunnanensis]